MATPAQLPKDVASKLLDMLGRDDEFRAAFEKDPVAALQRAGASETDAKNCAGCLKVGKLADKATIKASNQALTSMLTSAMSNLPHVLGSR